MKQPCEYQRNQRYRPLDELLAMPRIRILRALLHFDWVSGEDINVALDVFDPKLANNYSSNLSRLVREGFVERSAAFTSAGRRKYRRARLLRGGLSPMYTRYRITDAGRRELRDQLARAEVGDSGEAVSA